LNLNSLKNKAFRLREIRYRYLPKKRSNILKAQTQGGNFQAEREDFFTYISWFFPVFYLVRIHNRD
jgi:hypothetical protein